MDTTKQINPDATYDQIITSLEREWQSIERIIERRAQYLDAIDWTLMTEADRENAFIWREVELDHYLSWVVYHIANPGYVSWEAPEERWWEDDED